MGHGARQKLEAKDDIEASIEHLEQVGSRGWFEDDDDFQVRCDLALQDAKAAYSASKAGGGARKKATKGYVGPPKLPQNSNNVFSFGKPGKSSASSAGGWSGQSAPMGMKQKAAVSRVNAKGGAEKKMSSFAAAFDSDSDSD